MTPMLDTSWLLGLAAWMLGHLVIAEIGQGSAIGATPILLPDGFRDKHAGGAAVGAAPASSGKPPPTCPMPRRTRLLVTLL